ncbi:MAG: TRAP transporter small permease [Treponema sp.]|jgi:TRAP-type C4-dicarboxylate transport system permease small subunit|nr:TRAP transporter small permease [Treponema sp.]
MKIFKKILDGISKITEVLLMCSIAAIVLLILNEIFIRNVFNKSFRGVTEMAIFFFIWIVFLGFMLLFDKKRLIILDTFYAATKGKVKIIIGYIQDIIAICLGVVLILAFAGLYPFYRNMYFSSLPKFSKVWQHYPLVISGGFIALKGLYNVIERSIGHDNRIAADGGK